MAWYGLVDPANGDLISVGTEAMFPDGNLDAFVGTYDRHDFGEVAPDFATKVWLTASRQLANRPPPVIISRLDDIEAWLLSDPDFSAAWASFNTTRRAQVRNGIRRVLARALGPQQWREESEAVEL